MAIGQGGDDPTNRPGGPGPAGSGYSDVDPNVRRVALGFGNSPQVAANIQQQNTQNGYWTDIFKNFVPPDPAGNMVTGDGVSPGSFLPGGGTTGNGYQGTAAQGVDSLTGLERMDSNGGDISPEMIASIRRMSQGGMSRAPTPLGGGGGDGGPGSLGGPPQIPGYGGGPGGGSDMAPGDWGLDMTKPGAMEQYQKDHAGYFDQPTLSEMFAKNALAQGHGPTTNRAEEAFQQFKTQTPQNLDPYYDNQRRRATEALNKTMAARGSYGSSAYDDQAAEMNMNLAADQANREGQYGLQRGSLLGQLGTGADASSLAGSANDRNWTSTLGSIAGGADSAGLSRVIGGANVAGAAQGAQRTRGQDAFGNQMQIGNALSGVMGQGYGNIFGTDMNLINSIIGLNTGTAAEGYNQRSQESQQNRQDISNFNNTFGNYAQFAKGLNGAGGSNPSGTSSVSSDPSQVYGLGPPGSQSYETWKRTANP